MVVSSEALAAGRVSVSLSAYAHHLRLFTLIFIPNSLVTLFRLSISSCNGATVQRWICKRMKKISWLDRVTNGKGNIDGLAMFRDTTDFCMKLLKAE